MVRAQYNHWIHLPTREETIAKYGEEALCNDLLELVSISGGYAFRCQVLKAHDHKWHVVKGGGNDVGWTMAWRPKKQ